MGGRYTADGTLVIRPGGTARGSAVAATPAAAVWLAAELNRLLARAEAGVAHVADLLRQVPADDPDATAWTEQVGTPCGRVGDELVAVVPTPGTCPIGWEWHAWVDDPWHQTRMFGGSFAAVRRIPTAPPPPVEVGQYRQDEDGLAWYIGGQGPSGLWLAESAVGPYGERSFGRFRDATLATWPICDAPEGQQ